MHSWEVRRWGAKLATVGAPGRKAFRPGAALTSASARNFAKVAATEQAVAAEHAAAAAHQARQDRSRCTRV